MDNFWGIFLRCWGMFCTFAKRFINTTMAKAKPFIKWVGGKGQLIEQLEALLPADFDKRENVTYIEP